MVHSEAQGNEETAAVVREIVQILISGDDTHLVKSCIKKRQEISELVEVRTNQTKQLIKDLTSRVNAAEEEATRKEPKEAFISRMESMEAEKKQILDNIQRAEAECKQLTEASIEMKKEREKVLAQQIHFEEQHKVDVSKTREALGLYTNISKIHWDYNSPNIKGYITVAEEGDVRPFNLDPKTHSNYDIANYLWDLMS